MLQLRNIRSLEETHVLTSLLLCVFTFGFYYPFWQYKQIKSYNLLEETDSHSFLKWFFFSLLTLGLYHIYYEYKSSETIIELQKKFGLSPRSSDYPLLCLLVSFFGGFFISDMVHQEDLNKIIQKVKNAGSHTIPSSQG